MSTQFKSKTVLFDSEIGPYQVLPLRARVDLEVMAMNVYAAFSKAPALLKPHHQIVLCHIQDTRCGESYLSEEMQSVYSTAPADWIISIYLSIYLSMWVIQLIRGIFQKVDNGKHSMQLHLFKEIVMSPFMSQEAVNVTFTDC